MTMLLPPKLNEYPDHQVRDFFVGALVVGWCLCGVALILVGACVGVGKLIALVSH